MNELSDGRIIRVDPTTRMARVYSDQGSAQMWDGTHKLRDGSVITIKDGVLISESQAHPEEESSPRADVAQVGKQHHIPKEAVCVELAIKVCGFDGECSDSPGCSPARQLVELEKEEAWSDHAPNPNHTTMQCQQALNNEAFFEPCSQVPVKAQPSPCESLMEGVCGTGRECGDTDACHAAQQLLTFELEERIEKARRPERSLTTSRTCKQAAGEAFFAPCDLAAEVAE